MLVLKEHIYIHNYLTDCPSNGKLPYLIFLKCELTLKTSIKEENQFTYFYIFIFCNCLNFRGSRKEPADLVTSIYKQINKELKLSIKDGKIKPNKDKEFLKLLKKGQLIQGLMKF